MSNHLEHLESAIDVATTQLLIPLRMSKDLDLEAIQTLLHCVDQLKDVLGTSPTIPVGSLASSGSSSHRCSMRRTTRGHQSRFSRLLGSTRIV
jgi:hypothetical protein